MAIQTGGAWKPLSARAFIVAWLVRRTLMAALAAVPVLLLCGAPAHPAAGLDWSRSGQLLALWSDSGLYAADLERGGVVRLTPASAAGLCSPDGLQVAWSDGSGTYVHRSTAGTAARVADAGHVAGWSPDGKWVLLEASPPNQSSEIYAVDASGAGAVPVAPSPAADYDPAWSPDGRWIAFVSDRRESRPNIWVVGWDGSHLTRVTSMYAAANPVWSPDASKLVFAGQLSADKPHQIYCLDFKSGKLTAVTSASEGECHDPEFVGLNAVKYLGRDPTLVDLRTNQKGKLPRGMLSPTGNLLAALSGRPGSLEVINLRGGGRRSVDKGVEQACWSPDGRYLAYLALSPGPGRGMVRELRIAASDGKGLYVLWSEGVRGPG